VPWRAVRVLSKEPETIKWIDSFEPGDVLWDIGANIGVYTLYATLRPGVQIVAFEPAAGAYIALTRNIGLNDAHDRVAAYCLGISDTTGATRIYLEKPGASSAGHALHEPVNGPRGAFQPIDEQAVMSASIDDIASSFGLPFPNHIKVDVDGLEARVVRGGIETLMDARLKSILVETHGEAGLVLAGAGKLNKIYRRP
jgi:FkbM family methyltransferase